MHLNTRTHFFGYFFLVLTVPITLLKVPHSERFLFIYLFYSLDVGKLAEDTVGYVGADLAQLVREAQRRAATEAQSRRNARASL